MAEAWQGRARRKERNVGALACVFNRGVLQGWTTTLNDEGGDDSGALPAATPTSLFHGCMRTRYKTGQVEAG